MIKREPKLVMTFDTTHDAIAMEEECKKNGIAGRLIPVPSFIAAGCGLAWCTEPEMQSEMEEFVRAHSLGFAEFAQCVI